MNMCKITCRVTKGLFSKLKLFRLKKGMTQQELADKLGITQPQLAQIELGNRGQKFKPKRLEKLHEMGFEGKVTDTSLPDIKNIIITPKEKAKTILSNKQAYQSTNLFLEAFLSNFGLGFFLGVNTQGDVALSFYYNGEKIYSSIHRNGCSVALNTKE